jgi:hypothetical protein
VQTFSTWAPAAIACIGRVWDTLEDRSFEIKMQRKLATQKITKLRKKALVALRDSFAPRLARWSHDNIDKIKDDPAVPEILNDRDSDSAEPLLALADAIEGDLPQRARIAMVNLMTKGEDDQSIGVVLLTDLQEIFAESGKVELPSSYICQELEKLDERPWPVFGKRAKPISKNQLARLLGTFQIISTTVGNPEVPDGRLKGYKLKDCKDAFARYIPEPQKEAEEAEEFPQNTFFISSPPQNDVSDRSNVQPLRGVRENPLFQNVQDPSLNVSENGTLPHADKDLNARTVENDKKGYERKKNIENDEIDRLSAADEEEEL